MNKGRLVGAMICLALAVVLGIANFALSEDKLMFMVGDQNMPWVPPLILGIVGLALLVSAFTGKQADGDKPAEIIPQTPEAQAKAELNKRMETIGWGLFLIMLGGFILVPHTVIAKGLWAIGVGVIMLGLNAARYFNKIKMSGFTTFLGGVSLLSGVAQLMGMDPTWEGAILLIVLGAYLLAKPLLEKTQFFGKAEEG